jgi:hypothetical protein
MGEERRKRSTTQKFIQQFPKCCFCGGQRPSMTREHMPPKSLFDNSHRPDKLVMPACTQCNSGTSTADLTVAVVSRWSYDSGPQEISDHRKLVARVRKQAQAYSHPMMSIGSIPPIPWRCLIVRDFRRNFNRLPRRPDVEAEITAMDEHSQGQPIAISLVLPDRSVRRRQFWSVTCVAEIRCGISA